MSMVKVGQKGQIVIPKDMRDMMGIKTVTRSSSSPIESAASPFPTRPISIKSTGTS